MHPISIKNADHYLWGDQCEGWHLLRGNDLHVIQERVPPGKSEKPHFHSTARQFFFVLSGQAVMELGGEDHPLSERDGIYVAPGLVHRFKNPFAEPVEFLVISHPTARGDRTDLSD